jgi:hypothetical protein
MAPSGPLQRAVTAAARAAKIGTRDKAALELARHYARLIDEGDPVELLGPKLLAALDALVLTPKARANITKGLSHEPAKADPVDEIRARRAARQHHAATLDPTAT